MLSSSGRRQWYCIHPAEACATEWAQRVRGCALAVVVRECEAGVSWEGTDDTEVLSMLREGLYLVGIVAALAQGLCVRAVYHVS